jgi:DNA-binding GntR family transcriptional regulator
MHRKINSTKSSHKDHAPNRVRIVEGILDEIFSGRLEPGDRLVTDRLAAHFQVSQTPIREAIGTLAGMGVLVVKPNCGAVVRRFSPREVRDICQVRRTLETVAIGSACGRISSAKLSALRAQLIKQASMRPPIGKREIEQVKKSDTLLHDMIRQGARNQFLVDELDRIMVLVRAIRDAAWNRLLAQNSPDLAFVIEEAKEHLEIVDALIEKDGKRARCALRHHLLSGSRYIVRAVEDPTPHDNAITAPPISIHVGFPLAGLSYL